MNQLSETLTHIKTLSGGEEEGGGGVSVRRRQKAGSWAADGGVCVAQGSEVGLVSLQTHTENN